MHHLAVDHFHLMCRGCPRIATVIINLKNHCSDSAGWSEQIEFRTPPAGGSDELKFLAYGDMGKAPRDAAVEHYIQVGQFEVADRDTQNFLNKIFEVFFFWSKFQ